MHATAHAHCTLHTCTHAPHCTAHPHARVLLREPRDAEAPEPAQQRAAQRLGRPQQLLGLARAQRRRRGAVAADLRQRVRVGQQPALERGAPAQQAARGLGERRRRVAPFGAPEHVREAQQPRHVLRRDVADVAEAVQQRRVAGGRGGGGRCCRGGGGGVGDGG